MLNSALRLLFLTSCLHRTATHLVEQNLSCDDLVSAYYVEQTFMRYFDLYFEAGQVKRYAAYGTTGDTNVDRVLEVLQPLLPDVGLLTYTDGHTTARCRP